MSGIFPEDLLKNFFTAFQSDHLTTKAKYWTLPDVPTYPTIHMSGDVSLILGGNTRRFADGAFVFQKADGSLDALPSKSAWGGGITVDGGPVKPVEKNPYTNYRVGNMANLQYNEATKRVLLSMPEGYGGMAFRYPAPTYQELVSLAEREGTIMHVRNGEGKVLEGFFVKGQGGVLPSQFSTYHNGFDLMGGEFLSIHREANGELRGLFPYKPYNADELKNRYGGPPGNNVDQLKTLDGKPLSERNNPWLNLETEKGSIPRGYAPLQADMPALREQMLNERVKEAQLRQRLSEEFPDTFGPKTPIDEQKIREESGKIFDEKSKTTVGQRQLLSEVDELRRNNFKQALSYAETDGLPKPVLEPLPLRPALAKNSVSGLASELKASSLLEGAIGGSEKTLARTFMGMGKRAGLFGLGILGTAAAVGGIEYLLYHEPKKEQKEIKAGEALKIDFSASTTKENIPLSLLEERRFLKEMKNFDPEKLLQESIGAKLEQSSSRRHDDHPERLR